MGVWTPGPGPTDGNDTFVGDGTNEMADGGAGDDTLQGEGGNDTLIGGLGADTLNGGAGGDNLDGGVGADTMSGGAGNDSYIVDDVGDVVAEPEGVNFDEDIVLSSITFILGANLEDLTLTGTNAINGTGNVIANTIIGNSAANILSGEDNSDFLDGGAGADTL
ncbi:MAG TPA: calcium-binding protein, partial [Vitreimonas sp.]|nr:calcium-binding protein [Vitreimonas sp.]